MSNTTENKTIKQNIETLYGPDSELLKTCENYCLSRRNIHGFNEFLVHKLARTEANVLLVQLHCLTDYTEAEKAFEELCEIEVLEIRFLRQGFIKAPKPSGFDAMNDEEQEEWADSVLESKSDLELLNGMADFPNASRTGEYFDEAPRVAAIETPYGEELLNTTKEWNAFAYPNNSEPVKKIVEDHISVWHPIVVDNKLYSFELQEGAYDEPTQPFMGDVLIDDREDQFTIYADTTDNEDWLTIINAVEKAILKQKR